MKLIKSFCLVLISTTIFYSCSGLKEAGDVIRNDKTKSTDEFLIEKKRPLVQPPDFDVMPEPGLTRNKAKKEENSFQKILDKSEVKSTKSKSSSSSTENSILNQINK